jgi:PHD/YefM family antitoxin component YafN of YafNO toxin-antitoxin module
MNGCEPLRFIRYLVKYKIGDAMIASKHTQSLSDFRKKAAETIDRLNQTGEAEILTVNGEARAVLVAPAVYDELAREALLARDVAAIRRSIKQLDAGQGSNSNTVFAELRAELLAMKESKAEDTSA